MADLDLQQATTTNLDNTLDNFKVDAEALDFAGAGKETVWDFPDAKKHLGYLKNVAIYRNAVLALGFWTAGKGWETKHDKTKVELDRIRGKGYESFQSIMESMIVMKKTVGDAFCEIIRSDSGSLINLKQISPERMRVIYGEGGMLLRYEVRKGDGTFKRLTPNKVFHLCNDAVGDEIHGTSVLTSCKWVIDALHEAMEDHRIVIHRNRIPVRIIEVDTQDIKKRNHLIQEYQEAIKKGEVLVIPKGTVDIRDNTINIQDPTTWIKYLENFLYQSVGVPRIIATSEGFTEAGGKVGFLTFEPVYTKEQSLLESELWNQVAIRVKFKRPPSLMSNVQEDEVKNTGQLGFQPNDTTAGVGA